VKWPLWQISMDLDLFLFMSMFSHITLYLICTKLMPPESQLHTIEFLEEYSLVGNRALLPFRSECADRWRLEIDTPLHQRLAVLYSVKYRQVECK
jgi:hypothetical protein